VRGKYSTIPEISKLRAQSVKYPLDKKPFSLQKEFANKVPFPFENSDDYSFRL
jgi:hypothetical protein